MGLTITTIASGSKGNAYHISDGQTSLLLEAGVPFKQIQKALKFNLQNTVGCLITHEHMDHAKYTNQMLSAAINCYMSTGTASALNIEHHRIKTIQANKQYQIGTWTIIAFDVQHDVNEPFGFLIRSKEGDVLLFATDTYYIKQRFKGITHMMIECNYAQSVLDQNLEDGKIHNFLYKRVMKSHFSLENLTEFIKANDLSQVDEIHLLHLSDKNSDEKLMYETIAKLTGKRVIIAKGE